MIELFEPGKAVGGRSSPAHPSWGTHAFNELGPETTVPTLALVGSAPDAASQLGRHHVDVLRQFSAATRRVTSGQAMCRTCHWEGPIRRGPRAAVLDADAARHASATSGYTSPQFVGG
jgi:hypothetical protein